MKANLKSRSTAVDEVERWKENCNHMVRKLMPKERQLCDQVFFECSPTADLCFMEICREPTTQLLDFAEGKAIDFSPETKFYTIINILKVFQTIKDLLPEFQSLFSNEECVLLLNEAVETWKKLRETIRSFFTSLVERIGWDEKLDDPQSSLHVADIIMSDLRCACEFRLSLERTFEENDEPPSKKFDDQAPLSSSRSPLCLKVAKIMKLLESRLEGTYRLEKPDFQSVTMMNYWTRLIDYANDSELGRVLGEDWIHNPTAKFEKVLKNT